MVFTTIRRWREGAGEIAAKMGPPLFTGISPDQNWIEDDDEGDSNMNVLSVLAEYAFSNLTSLVSGPVNYNKHCSHFSFNYSCNYIEPKKGSIVACTRAGQVGCILNRQV